MPSLRRTGFLLGPKESDSRIDRKPREMVLSLSRKIKNLTSLYPFFPLARLVFFFPSPFLFSYEFFSFVFYSFLLLFSLFLFSSHFPIISSSHFFLFFFFLFALSLLLFGALTIWVKRRKFPPPLPQAKFVWLSIFLSLFLISLFPL